MNTRILKYLLDLESVIAEIEQLRAHVSNDYSKFLYDPLARRAAERQLEIIGEAIGKLKTLSPEIKITNAEKMIGMRHLIVHAYDAIDEEIIWSVIIKDIPQLKIEIQDIRKSHF